MLLLMLLGNSSGQKILRHFSGANVSNSTVAHVAPHPGTSHSHWYVYVIVVVVLAGLFSIGVYWYMKHKQHQIYLNYSTHPEEGIPKKKMNFKDRSKFNDWDINANKETKSEFVVVAKKQSRGVALCYVQITTGSTWS